MCNIDHSILYNYFPGNLGCNKPLKSLPPVKSFCLSELSRIPFLHHILRTSHLWKVSLLVFWSSTFWNGSLSHHSLKEWRVHFMFHLSAGKSFWSSFLAPSVSFWDVNSRLPRNILSVILVIFQKFLLTTLLSVSENPQKTISNVF